MLKTRAEIDDALKWRLTFLYPSVDAWNQEFSIVAQPNFFKKLTVFEGRLKEGEKAVFEALKTAFDLERRLEKLFAFVKLKSDEDIAAREPKERYEKARSLLAEFEKVRAFIEPELLCCDEKLLQQYLQSDLLAPYRFYLEKIVRMRPHILTKEQEELMALLNLSLAAPQKIFSVLHNVDLAFAPVIDSGKQTHPLTHALYALYLQSPDPSLRQSAFFNLHKPYEQYVNTFAEMLTGKLEGQFFEARARKFNNTLEAALYSWAIPPTVYTHLISTAHDHIHLLHRYVLLKKKWLGLEKIHFYDLYARPNSDEKLFTPQEAIELTVASVAPLGENYQNTLQQGLQQGWVDWSESVGKRSGAYSSGTFDGPPYILMNFRGTERDLFTLAHEAGHSMHSHLSRTSQPFHYFHYPIFVAEIASTLNEELLMHELLTRTSSKRARLQLLHGRLEDIRATFWRQTLFAEFELLIHQKKEGGNPLTADLFKEIYLKLNHFYYGDALILDEPLAVEWARIPHFYYNFYVYQYATGIALAMAMAKKVLAKEAAPYLRFLSSGGSNYPSELLRQSGFDIEKPTFIIEALHHFESLLDEFEKALKNGD